MRAVARPLTVMQLLPALQAGGVERSTLEIAAALTAAGHRSIVVSAGGRLVGQLKEQGSEHIELDIGAKSPWVLRQVPALRRLLREIKPDVVHARSRLPAWIAAFALRGRRGDSQPHFVTTVHGLNSPSRYSAIMTRGERVICVSQTVRNYVLCHYPNTDPARLRVIPRGISPAEFPRGHEPTAEWRGQFAHEFPGLVGAPLLLLPGRGTRLKGHGDAIALLAQVRARGLPAHLLMVGALESGREAYAQELLGMARRLGVADALVMTPTRGDLRELYACSNLVLQLSRKPEAFGRTVVEALSVGVPVLGYDHGGVGELLAELYPDGRVAMGRPDDLVEGALRLLRAPPPVPAVTNYRLADMQAATLAIYRELATGGPAAAA